MSHRNVQMDADQRLAAVFMRVLAAMPTSYSASSSLMRMPGQNLDVGTGIYLNVRVTHVKRIYKLETLCTIS